MGHLKAMDVCFVLVWNSSEVCIHGPAREIRTQVLRSRTRLQMLNKYTHVSHFVCNSEWIIFSCKIWLHIYLYIICFSSKVKQYSDWFSQGLWGIKWRRIEKSRKFRKWVKSNTDLLSNKLLRTVAYTNYTNTLTC